VFSHFVGLSDSLAETPLVQSATQLVHEEGPFRFTIVGHTKDLSVLGEGDFFSEINSKWVKEIKVGKWRTGETQLGNYGHSYIRIVQCVDDECQKPPRSFIFHPGLNEQEHAGYITWAGLRGEDLPLIQAKRDMTIDEVSLDLRPDFKDRFLRGLEKRLKVRGEKYDFYRANCATSVAHLIDEAMGLPLKKRLLFRPEAALALAQKQSGQPKERVRRYDEEVQPILKQWNIPSILDHKTLSNQRKQPCLLERLSQEREKQSTHLKASKTGSSEACYSLRGLLRDIRSCKRLEHFIRIDEQIRMTRRITRSIQLSADPKVKKGWEDTLMEGEKRVRDAAQKHRQNSVQIKAQMKEIESKTSLTEQEKIAKTSEVLKSLQDTEQAYRDVMDEVLSELTSTTLWGSQKGAEVEKVEREIQDALSSCPKGGPVGETGLREAISQRTEKMIPSSSSGTRTKSPAGPSPASSAGAR
ncbi:MAG: hypothetical protein ACO3A2_11705, partial [Bdellovibrionia bacterium]